jgi:hypothetical protein
MELHMKRSIFNSHTEWQTKRTVIASVLTLIYLLILLSPLASPALYSQPGADALPGECSGDCVTDGCSIESRAGKNCCCARKKLQHSQLEHSDKMASTQECCKKNTLTKKTVIISCGYPCKDGKHVVMSANDSSDLIPFYFTESCNISHSATTFTYNLARLTSRHGDPPDPPPKLSLNS